jgi:hypothetical protein
MNGKFIGQGVGSEPKRKSKKRSVILMCIIFHFKFSQAKCKRDGKWPEESALKYNFFGNKRITKDDMFHYTDRKAGKGYMDFCMRIK